MSPRVYSRKFDWDEVRRRHSEGESMSAIARDLGVSQSAVWLACNDAARARQQTRGAEYQRSGICPDCSGPASRNRSTGQNRCRACAAKAQVTNVREAELRCTTCCEWKPDAAFPFNRAGRKLHRGRHQHCRACLTKLRQDYRERHKVPCRICGKLCLPPSEKRTNGAAFPRCRSCQVKAMWADRKAAA